MPRGPVGRRPVGPAGRRLVRRARRGASVRRAGPPLPPTRSPRDLPTLPRVRMAERERSGRVVVLSSCWGGPDPEASFVMRGLAGALSRHAVVDVVVPGPPSTPRPDGLFDV